MRKLDEHKLAKLHTAGELLDNKYGAVSYTHLRAHET